ncbi:hypothetical protein [Desertivirga xinjiangensis]|uniref:hypothetical protein n=1 Tax=Desertivirga xinjiangensis TaxID=539206 RepID=UPI00210E65FC|nr:hypothetical protein [Pedobacter xinjiangensis]
MKQTLSLLLVVVLLWSCQKQDSGPTESKLINNSSKNGVSTIKSDPVWNLLGYGYDAAGEFARASAAKGKVLNIQALKNDFPSAVEVDPAGFQQGVITAGSNAVDYSKELTKKGGSIVINTKPLSSPFLDLTLQLIVTRQNSSLLLTILKFKENDFT